MLLEAILALNILIHQQDLRFNIIQEEWVASQSKNPIADAPELIKRLAHDRYAEREAAYNELGWKGVLAWRELVWASYAKEPEIANRASCLLVRWLKCLECKGEGMKHSAYINPSNPASSFWICSKCNGSGTIYDFHRKF